MALTDIAGRSILKRLTGLKSYLNNTEQDEEDVINNELLSGGLLNQDITPASSNQNKQSAIVSLKPLTEQMNSLIESYPGSSDIIGGVETPSTDLNVKTSEIEPTYGPRAPTTFTVPKIGGTDEENDFSTMRITQEELDALKKEEEPPHHESKDLLGAIWEDISGGTKKFFSGDYAWQQEVKILAYSKVYDVADIYGFDEEEAENYRNDIAIAAQVKNGIDECLYTQEQYDEVVETIKNEYGNNISKRGLSQFYRALDNDISGYQIIINAQNKLNKIDPSVLAEVNAKNTQINTATAISMEKVQQSAKYSNLGIHAQEFIKDSYTVFNDQYTRWVNALSPARRVKTQLINRYGTEDTSQYSEADKAIMEDINNSELVLKTFTANFGNRVAQYAQFADKTTGMLIVPDIIDGVNLHDAIFAGIENILTNEDYGAAGWLGEGNASAQDVLSTMSANIATKYSMEHGTWVNQGWTATQNFLRPVGEVANELSQQSFGYVGVGAYNLLSKKSGRISFDALNQDATLLSTLNTNNGATGRLIQKYAANTLEYTPEVVGNTIDVFKLASLPQKIRNATKFRALLNTGIRPVITALKSTGKTTAEAIAELPKALETIGQGGKIAGVGLRQLNNQQRFWRYVISDAVPELVWDQIIDASLSVADSDFGSDTSMTFSLGGTAIGTLGVKLAEAGLFQMGKNGLSRIKELAQDGTVKTSWMDGTVWNVLDTLSNENIDALVKSTYGLNSSQLATWEELKRFTSDFKVVSDTVKAAYNTLTGSQKAAVTTATKGKLGDTLSSLINQVYGADSQFARRIRQLINDDRTNPADVFKYALGVRGQVEIGGWKSKISLVDSSDIYVHGYNERLDTIPEFASTGFGRKLREGLTEDDLKALASNNVSWAKDWGTSGNFKKGNNGKYYFTKKGLDSANDIRSSSLDVAIVSTVTETAEEFDTLMKNSNIKKISDKTLQDIKDSGAYDTLADALAELAWLCGIEF